MSAAIESSSPMPLPTIAMKSCAVAAGNRGVEEFDAPCPEAEGVAGLRQVQGQWPAHEAEADEADIHWVVSRVDGRVGLALRGARPAG